MDKSELIDLIVDALSDRLRADVLQYIEADFSRNSITVLLLNGQIFEISITQPE